MSVSTRVYKCGLLSDTKHLSLKDFDKRILMYIGLQFSMQGYMVSACQGIHYYTVSIATVTKHPGNESSILSQLGY